jgi:hypothetical protein
MGINAWNKGTNSLIVAMVSTLLSLIDSVRKQTLEIFWGRHSGEGGSETNQRKES